LPSSFLTQFPQGVEIAFEMIPIIPSLDQPLKDGVRNTFGAALKVVWQVVLGIAIAGIFCSIGMKQLELHTEINEDWGREVLPDERRWSFRSFRSSLKPTELATNVSEA